MTVLKPSQTFSLSIWGPWILLVTWVMVQSFVLWHYGIVTPVDSDFYLSKAQVLSQGHLPIDRGLWYSSYSLFLAFVMNLGGSLFTVVILQILFSGVASLVLYKVVYKLFQQPLIAFLAVLHYLLWFKIHQWNSYIYTESLFISFSIISFALLCLSKQTLHYVLTALVIAFTLFLRPTGLCFFIALCGYFIFAAYQQKRVSSSYLLLIISTLISGLLLVNAMLEEYIYYFIDSYRKAELIYPGISLGLVPPQSLDIPSTAHEPLVQLVEFIFYNPLYFLKLFGLKCVLFLGNVKPYFSWAHNAMIVCILYPIYGFALYGIKKTSWTKEKVFMIGFILMQILTVSMTSENWDGRFLILILPFIFIYSAVGIDCCIKKYKNKKNDFQPTNL